MGCARPISSSLHTLHAHLLDPRIFWTLVSFVIFDVNSEIYRQAVFISWKGALSRQGLAIQIKVIAFKIKKSVFCEFILFCLLFSQTILKNDILRSQIIISKKLKIWVHAESQGGSVCRSQILLNVNIFLTKIRSTCTRVQKIFLTEFTVGRARALVFTESTHAWF